MKFKIVLITALSLYALSNLAQEVKLTAFYPGEIWKDNNGVAINAHGGGILFYKHKYYWFGEHKIEGEEGNLAQVGIHCYSSTDLYNWTDNGIALKVSNDPLSPIAKGCIIERPKVIYNKKSKQFVMWFHHELKGQAYNASLTGVAVSENVIGPYRYLNSIRPNQGQWPINVLSIHKKPVPETILSAYCGGPGCLPDHPDTLNLIGRDFAKGQMSRDMNLYVDEDGSAYHIHSSEENSTIHISKLSNDYLSFTGEYARVFINRYMEGATLFKFKGKYYIIASGCTGWAPNTARMAVADHIYGPYTELGNPCIGKEADKTFESQSTFVFPLPHRKNAFVFMADRWNPKNAIDGRYVWLPIILDKEKPYIKWFDSWSFKSIVK